MSGKATVVGHTDDVGSPADNQDLSNRRATTVTKRLTERLSGRGIALTAVGRGESQPLVPNVDDASRARNRRVSVVFSGSRPSTTDPYDIAVSGYRPAPPAGGPAAAGSVLGTTQTFTLGPARKNFRVRLDVTRVTRLDSLVLVETSVQLLSGEDLNGYQVLFSGHSYRTDEHRTALYDRAAGKELPVVVDGTGAPLRSPLDGELKPRIPRHDWFLLPTPSGSGGPLQLYIPAFGLLNVPLS